MAKCVMLAVAGAGKTYTICNNLDADKKNLILAFTHENIYNINKELIKKFGHVPELTNVMTYDSFLYRYVLCPYEPTILRAFNEKDFVRKGITISKPPEMTKIINGKRIPNKSYRTKDKLSHYEINGRYYCDTLSELILYVKEDRKKLINKVADAINMFYDQVCIDEFQDFRKYDFEFIISLAKKLNNVLLVGDYYQHSVSGDNNSGKPFDKMSMPEFINFLEQNTFDVDTTTLKNSRRCPKSICEFVEQKLRMQFGCENTNKGEIIWLNGNDAHRILCDNNIVKLTWNNAKKYIFNAVNWSYSKGDTYDDVCIILTEKMSDLQKDTFDVSKIEEITKNKLYVAITRTRGNLYLITKKEFDKVKEIYLER